MTEAEFRLQAEDQIAFIMEKLRTDAMEKVDLAIRSGAIPEDWKRQGDHRLSKAIIDSICVDRPLAPSDKQNKKDFKNLSLFI